MIGESKTGSGHSTRYRSGPTRTVGRRTLQMFDQLPSWSPRSVGGSPTRSVHGVTRGQEEKRITFGAGRDDRYKSKVTSDHSLGNLLGRSGGFALDGEGLLIKVYPVSTQVGGFFRPKINRVSSTSELPTVQKSQAGARQIIRLSVTVGGSTYAKRVQTMPASCLKELMAPLHPSGTGLQTLSSTANAPHCPERSVPLKKETLTVPVFW